MAIEYRWSSDLHLDHLGASDLRDFLAKVKAECASPDTVFLCTGDTTTARNLAEHHYQLASNVAGRMLYVLGNHDRWGLSFAGCDERLRVNAVHMPNATFMDHVDSVELEPGTFAVGDSGWYDGRNGTQGRPQMLMNDWYFIREYQGREPYQASAQFADERAKRLEAKMRKAIAAGAQRLLVLMHVPPYVEACRYLGNPSDAYALPWFSSQVFGDVLDQVAEEHWHVPVEVVCGHTHDPFVYKRKDNLVVHVMKADYGDPRILAWRPTLW